MDLMKFKHVAQSFDHIEKVASRNEMTIQLSQLFSRLTPYEAKIVAYMSLGELNPPYVGTQFNIASKTMVNIVARTVNVSSDEIVKQIKKMGDAGAVIATYDWNAKEELEIIELYDWLCKIEDISGIGSQEEKSNQLIRMLQALDPLSAKYVIRIVLSKLRLGFSDMTLIDAFSWMIASDKTLKKEIENAYNMSADIGKVAFYLVRDGIDGIKDIVITVGIPIRPASAERQPSVEKIIERLGECRAQLKLDGFRLQIHINNGVQNDDKPKKTLNKESDYTKSNRRVCFFSRHLKDMSNMFPDMIDALTALPVKNIICEGEAICYDTNTGNFLPFQETVKRKRKHDIEEVAVEYPLRIYLFDLLYLDGESCIEKTHDERRALLENIFKKITNDKVQLIEEKTTKTVNELNEYFLSAINQGLEGLVVKRPDAVYQPGKRNFNWIKLKRKEGGHLRDSIDAVVLGYYAGRGKRAKFGIGAFLVGVYNKDEDVIQTVAKIGTGLKDDEWIALRKKCDLITISEKPKDVMCAKELHPDVWVTPEIICEIYADEITLSPLHTAGKTDEQLGFALRFPRFVRYRDDKDVSDTTGPDEIKRLYETQF